MPSPAGWEGAFSRSHAALLSASVRAKRVLARFVLDGSAEGGEIRSRKAFTSELRGIARCEHVEIHSGLDRAGAEIVHSEPAERENYDKRFDKIQYNLR